MLARYDNLARYPNVFRAMTDLRVREFEDFSERTGRRLWKAIPRAYHRSRCYSDFWAAYAAVVPTHLHRAVGVGESLGGFGDDV